MNKPIGGYFEWEFPKKQKFKLHDNAILLNSGRHALEYILRGLKGVKRLYIPYFICDVILQPLKRLNVSYEFYHINERLELRELFTLHEGDYLLYTNYYGIKDAYVYYLSAQYRDRLIIDNAQALFYNTHSESHQIYSPRKYLGMPDGGIAITSVPDYTKELPTDLSNGRCSHLLKRLELIPSEGYDDFKVNSSKIANATLSNMSNISKSILSSVDFKEIKQKRRVNFKQLHDVLSKTNKLNIPSLDSFECPLVYPYWTADKGLKKHMIDHNVFIATYWPNVFEWAKKSDLEYEIAEHLVCIPIDQRYNCIDIDRIIKVINL